jgi:predicted transcriptional regulator
MIQAEQVEPVLKTDRSSATDLLRRRAEAGEPVVLALDGQVELVVRDATSQQLLFDLVDRLETIAAVQEGLDAADRGEGRPAAEVFAEISLAKFDAVMDELAGGCEGTVAPPVFSREDIYADHD